MKLGADDNPRRRATDSYQLSARARGINMMSVRQQRRAARDARNTITRTAKIITAGVVFDVTASTTRDFVGNERTRYRVMWNTGGGDVAGTFAQVCKQVARAFGQPCATHLLGAILCKLPPNGVSWPREGTQHSLFAARDRGELT